MENNRTVVAALAGEGPVGAVAAATTPDMDMIGVWRVQLSEPDWRTPTGAIQTTIPRAMVTPIPIRNLHTKSCLMRLPTAHSHFELMTSLLKRMWAKAGSANAAHDQTARWGRNHRGGLLSAATLLLHSPS
jgi:hypothetical protein